MKTTKYFLDETKLPKEWYNIAADLPGPLPPVLHPATLQPVGPDDLAPLFPMSLIMQEVSTERYIAIPCLLYTSPSPRDRTRSRMPSSA